MPSGFYKGDKLSIGNGYFGIKRVDKFAPFQSCLEDSGLLNILVGVDKNVYVFVSSPAYDIKDLTPWELWQWQE